MTRTHNIAVALALFVGSACTSATEPFVADPEPEGAQCTIEGTKRFLPLAEGVQWTVRTIRLKSGLEEDKTTTVGAIADIGGDKAGVVAFRLATAKDNGEAIAWQEDTGTAVVRHLDEDRAGLTHKDEVFFAHKTRLDESPEYLVEGAAWSESLMEASTNIDTLVTTETDKTYEWTVPRFGEEVTVPAGTFCTMQVTRTTVVDGIEGRHKQYWFARGIGKVKERDGNRREVLLDFTIPL